MKDNRNNNTSGGIGFIGLLQIVFITLKLLNKITWSWLLVLAPMWITFVLVLIYIIITIIIFRKDLF